MFRSTLQYSYYVVSVDPCRVDLVTAAIILRIKLHTALDARLHAARRVRRILNFSMFQRYGGDEDLSAVQYFCVAIAVFAVLGR